MGLGRLAWIASSARRVTDGRWAIAADAIARELGLRRPVAILQTDHPALLVTWGFVQPQVILPRAAPDWTDAIAVGNVTSVTLDIAKDNLQFGVRAVDKAGHRSPVGFPVTVST